jgi:hypothetical protein
MLPQSDAPTKPTARSTKNKDCRHQTSLHHLPQDSRSIRNSDVEPRLFEPGYDILCVGKLKAGETRVSMPEFPTRLKYSKYVDSTVLPLTNDGVAAEVTNWTHTAARTRRRWTSTVMLTQILLQVRSGEGKALVSDVMIISGEISHPNI